MYAHPSAPALTPAAALVFDAFPGSRPAAAVALWAGPAALDPAAAPAGYLDELPAGLVAAIRQAAPEWVWAPCTVCGEGILIKAPPTPKVDREIGNNDGPRCMMPAAPISGRCEGRHYPVDGPLPHPLVAPAVTEVPW